MTMGTNFYAHTADTPDTELGLHIGKKSAGWDFMFRSHEDNPAGGPTTVQQWRELLSDPECSILCEYWSGYTPEEFWSLVEKHPGDRSQHMYGDYVDTDADFAFLKQDFC